VGLIGIAAIHLARRDDADRRLAPRHAANLHRRGVGAQQAAIREIEGVVHGARRMVRREVQGLEVVPVVLDFRAIGDLVTQALEDRHDPSQGARYRMCGATLTLASRQGDVDALARQSRRQGGGLQIKLSRSQGFGQAVTQLVDVLALAASQFRRQGTQALEQGRDGAGLAQQAHTHGVEGIERGGCCDVGQRRIGQWFQIVH